MLPEAKFDPHLPESGGPSDPDSRSLEYRKYPFLWYGYEGPTVISVLSRNYGISPAEASGRYFLRCSVAGGECRLCMGRRSYSCNQAHLAVSLPYSEAVSLFMQQQIHEARMLSRIMYYITGKGPGEEDRDNPAPISWRDRIERFPYDVKIFDNKQCQSMIDFQNRERKHGREPSPESVWDVDRVRACLGKDPIKARCAMSDALWKMHRQSRSGLTEIQAKRIFAIGVLVEELKKVKKDSPEEEALVKMLDYVTQRG